MKASVRRPRLLIALLAIAVLGNSACGGPDAGYVGPPLEEWVVSPPTAPTAVFGVEPTEWTAARWTFQSSDHLSLDWSSPSVHVGEAIAGFSTGEEAAAELGAGAVGLPITHIDPVIHPLALDQPILPGGDEEFVFCGGRLRDDECDHWYYEVRIGNVLVKLVVFMKTGSLSLDGLREGIAVLDPLDAGNRQAG